MVDGEREDVVVPPQPEETGAEERPGGEVERRARLGFDRLAHDLRKLVGRRGIDRQRLDRETEGPRVAHPLHRLAVHLRERRPQRLVAADERVQRPLQRARVERAAEAEDGGEVVDRAAGAHPVEEPEPPLRERRRQRPAA
ncbi:MAG TPA: hypothetical protein VHG91_05815, partial [Longimicrobium sp.]|nr:hypothetical protein [Longimicrobium sp.]